MSAAHDSAATSADSTHTAPQAEHPFGALTAPSGPLPGPALTGLLGNTSLRGRGNGPVHQAAILQLQATQGNRATRRLLQRLAGPGAPTSPAQTGTPAPA